MFIKFSEEAQKILKNAKMEMCKLKHSFIGSEHVLLSILNSKTELSQKLLNYGLNYELFKEELIKNMGIGESNNEYLIYTPLLKRVLENALMEVKDNNGKEITLEDIMLSILDEGEGVAVRILTNLGFNIDDLYEELNKNNKCKKNNKKLLINDCSIDLTKKAFESGFDPLIGRDKEVNEVIEILLRRNKNNPLLIGEAGVGKTAIVEELASRIVKGKVPDKLKNKRILSLSVASCVAGTKYRGEFEERINKILKELETNDNLIVFIDEVHTIVGAGGAEGAIDASNILKPALARGNIRLIGATTIKEYKDTIAKDKALNRRFQNIIIQENNLLETKKILYNLKNIYEDYHHVNISIDVIDSLVELTDKYIKDRNNPDKSLDILDIVCTKVSLNKGNKYLKLDKLKEELNQIKEKKNRLIIHHQYNEASSIKENEMQLESTINEISLSISDNKRKIITREDVASVIESKTHIPIYEIHHGKEKLVDLACKLKKIVIGQDDVIDKITKVTKKILLGLKNNLPYSFLFIGNSGVGKTMLVKEYSKYLNIPLIRLDMSEYKEAHSVSKIIGSPPGYVGYNDTDNVLEKIKNNPYCIILLDEIEKAHPEVINLFLQALDEGIITNCHGEKIYLNNAIIFMTSNIGCDKEVIGFNNNVKVESEIRNFLSTPLVNRINLICSFNHLTRDDIDKIIKLKIHNIKKKYQNEVNIRISKKIIDDIIDESDYEIYGARRANKLLEEKIDDIIINNLLKKRNTLKI